jgi:hypothetical protein
MNIARNGMHSRPNGLRASERFLYDTVEICTLYIDSVPAIG